jgi:uncharacterized protein YbjT (DUF2867 family)
MKILLTGASGFIGKHITTALTAAGHDVIPATRAHGFDFNQMRDADDWLAHLHEVEAVINSVGIIAECRTQTFARLHAQAPTALFKACARAGVKRVIQISALGADESAFTPYQQSKKAADDLLRGLPMDWFILRPSLVYGPGGKSMALFQQMASLPVIPLVARGLQWIQPVHISDLVAAVLQCLTASPAQRTIDIVGPYPVTFVDWLQQIRKVGGRTAAPILSIPFGLAVATAKLARHVVPMMHPDNLRMLQHGNTAEVQAFAELLGKMPLTIEDCAAGEI